MVYTLDQIYLLSPYERKEFRGLRGVDQLLTADEFLLLANTTGPHTLALKDLALAKSTPILEFAIRHSDLLKMSSDNLTNYALALRLDPTTPNLIDRIVRILRFKRQLIPDYDFVFPSTPIKINEIMCERLRLNDIPSTFVNNACTMISGRITTNLVRVAATRIFSEPEQSFVEPIVNSLDAYRIKRGTKAVATGKFGMGFFSLMYWLVVNPKEASDRKLTITSTFLDPMGVLQSWSAVITVVNDNFVVDLTTQPPDEQPGLKIELEYVEKHWGGHYELISWDTVVKTLSHKVTNVTTGRILVYFSGVNSAGDVNERMDKNGNTPYKTYGDPTSPNLVIFRGVERVIPTTTNEIITKSTISIQDFATGIPTSALSYLLVPTLSTKTIAATVGVYQPVVGSATGIFTKKPFGHFQIVVGQITVYEIRYRLGESKITPLFVLQLSPQTQLPVGRDDIIFNPTVKAEFELNVMALVDQGLTKQPNTYIMELIKCLQLYPKGRYMVPKIMDYLRETDWIPVPFESHQWYKEVFPTLQFVGVDQLLTLENETRLILLNPGNDKLFFGRHVYIIGTNTDLITIARSTRLVFLGSRYANVTAETVADLVMLFQDQGLIPLGTQWQSQKTKEQANLTSIISTIVGKMIGLKSKYRFDVNYLIDSFNRTYTGWPEDKQEVLYHVFTAVGNSLATMNPSVSYGSLQPVLHLSHPSFLAGVKLDSDKFDRYFTEFLYRLAPLSNKVDILTYAGTLQISFGGKFFELTNNLSEYLYISLLTTCVGFSETDCRTAQTARDPRVKSSRSYPPLTNKVSEVKILLRYWRSQLGTPTHERELYEHLASVARYGVNDTLYTYPPLYNVSALYLNVYRSSKRLLQSELPTLVIPSGEVYEFPLSQLIQQVFQGDVTDDFYTLIKRLPNTPGVLPIQILEIAINEGTTKPPLEAMIIETVQNALDALRSTGVVTGVGVKIETGVGDKGNNMLTYRISDPVGIPNAGLLSLSIPFLSTKTAGQVSAGEMGSGFFNVYRRAKKVNIVTVRDGVKTTILDTPKRQLDRIIDVDRMVAVNTSTEPNGTVITIYIDSSEPVEDATSILALCQTAVAAAAGPFGFTLNGIPVELKRTLFYTTDYIDAYVTESPIESYVLTKGVPFGSLAEVGETLGYESMVNKLLVHVSTHLIINLKRGFTPTQSRTALIHEAGAPLVGDFMSALYYYILTLQLEHPDFDYVENYTSRSYFDAVAPDPKHYSSNDTIFSFIWYYQPKYKSPKLADVVNNSSLGSQVHPLMQQVAAGWLSTKLMTSVRPPITRTITPKEDLALKFANKFVEVFWSRIPEEYRHRPAPKVELSTLTGALGVYIQLDHKIVVRHMPSLPSPLTIDALLGYFQNEAEDMFGKRSPPSIMIHELEHAWRNSSHSDGSHSEIELNFNGVSKKYSFNEAANAMYDYVLQQGLIGGLLA
jgi:hypothetical protein